MTQQRAPRVFISYSHEGELHQQRVLDLADQLRLDGIDAELDQYNPAPAEGWPLWCERQIEAANFVLMICTDTYRRRIKGGETPGEGLGVVWEAAIIRQLIFDAGAISDKFIPVLFADGSPEHIPTPIKGWSRYVVDAEGGYEALYRRLTKQPDLPRPGLGRIRPLPPRQRRSTSRRYRNEQRRKTEGEARRATISFILSYWRYLVFAVIVLTVSASPIVIEKLTGTRHMDDVREQENGSGLSAARRDKVTDIMLSDSAFMLEEAGNMMMQVGDYLQAAKNFESASKAVPGIDAKRRARYLTLSAEALFTQADEKGDNALLRQVVDLYRRALSDLPRNDDPLQWAMAQDGLGRALTRLGQRELDVDLLNEAISAYQAALEERTQERAPLERVRTTNNLAIALLRLGEQSSDEKPIEAAVETLRAVLEELDRGRSPLDWATTQTNLGNALLVLSGGEAGSARLQEAVGAYRLALQELPRERFPVERARVQTNLAAALASLGEREGGTKTLSESVASYRAALKEWVRDRNPLAWAAAYNGLGRALATIGQRESGTANLEEAVRAFELALEERTLSRVPLEWAESQTALGATLAEIGKRKKDAQKLMDARGRLRRAYEAYMQMGREQLRPGFEQMLKEIDQAIDGLA